MEKTTHSAMTCADGVHRQQRWEVANDSARLAMTVENAVPPLVLGGVCLQADGKVYDLIQITPSIVWQRRATAAELASIATIASKADDAATTSALATKADATATTSALASKADASATTTALGLKANASALTTHTGDVANPHAVTAGQVSAWRTPGMRLMAFGDSFVAQPNAGVINSNAYPAFLDALSMGRIRFDPSNNKGVSGNTTSQMLARYAADVAANYANFDILYVSGGRNDYGIPTTTVSNLSSICDSARAAGKLVLLEIPNPPRNGLTDSYRIERGRINRAMEQYAASRPGVIFIDFSSDWIDPTVDTGNAATGVLQVDDLHPTQDGAMRAARRILAQLSPLLPVSTPKHFGAWDRFNVTTNPNGNLLALTALTAPRLAGTGGTVSAPLTGTAATNWTLTRFSGSGTEIVASKEAGVAGYDSPGTDTQLITLTSTSASATCQFNGAAVTLDASLIGRSLEAQLDVQLTGLDNKLYGFSLWLYWGGVLNAVIGNTSVGGEILHLPDGWYRLRTPPIAISAASPTTAFLRFQFGAVSGSTGTIRLRNPVIHPLP